MNPINREDTVEHPERAVLAVRELESAIAKLDSFTGYDLARLGLAERINDAMDRLENIWIAVDRANP